MGHTAKVGAWTVTVSPNEVTAYRGNSSETYSANVILFPVGYRVGKVWSPELPPKTVIRLAASLANKLP